jgi:hypothetical protein
MVISTHLTNGASATVVVRVQYAPAHHHTSTPTILKLKLSHSHRLQLQLPALQGNLIGLEPLLHLSPAASLAHTLLHVLGLEEGRDKATELAIALLDNGAGPLAGGRWGTVCAVLSLAALWGV